MAILGVKNNVENLGPEQEFHLPVSKKALIVFTRNPELGRCKTRLAATIGDKSALDVYRFLLDHTVKITSSLSADVYVYYSEKIREIDIWDTSIFRKKQQQGLDLGAKMQHAFTEVFGMGYQKAIIIGSDMYDINTQDLEDAFLTLEHNNFVVGPAQDGGYYLLGMKQLKTSLFKNKKWGTTTVLSDTLQNLTLEKVSILPEKNDVDYFDDIRDIAVFEKFFSHLKD
jgi:rSAM/selenodomain-associated transferase 1